MASLIKGLLSKARFHSECFYVIVVIDVVTAVLLLGVTNNEVMCICIPVQPKGTKNSAAQL